LFKGVLRAFQNGRHMILRNNTNTRSNDDTSTKIFTYEQFYALIEAN